MIERMTKYDLTLSVEHNCPYTRFSKSLPDLITMHWCNNDKDVLEISSPGENSQMEIERGLKRLVRDLNAKITRSIPVDSNHKIVVYNHKASSMKENVNAEIERCNCVEVQPTIYRSGSEWYRIIAFDDQDVRALYKALSKFATVRTVSQEAQSDSSIKESLLIPSSALLGRLTKKQTDALRSSIAMGYFDVPARTTTSFIAEKQGIGRTTFEEHVRKAEGKILKSLLPYLEMHQ
jgi:predicted DNA binding protein